MLHLVYDVSNFCQVVHLKLLVLNFLEMLASVKTCFDLHVFEEMKLCFLNYCRRNVTFSIPIL